MPTDPVPIVVEASGEFLGNDGAWSPFLIEVGNPPTELRVLASTEVPETWIVDYRGCTSTDARNCTEARGGVYNLTASKSWLDKKIDTLGAEANLEYTVNSDVGQFGFDTLGVAVSGRGNVSLDDQLVATVATKDFFLGNLGLANRQHDFGDGTHPTGFLSQLNASNLIPSLSYGYTAGASYHQTNASLTLGGFDASRFTPNDVTFTFAKDPLRSKMVALQLVVATDSEAKETSLLDTPILALVDSTVPHIWLPEASCNEFEKAFGITYDVESQYYLINSTAHDALVKRDATISFQLSNSQSGGPSVNITLPYASFDLKVDTTVQGIHDPSRYFPLRRALNDSMYTLGRTFFQESYLIVNHENQSFSISQAVSSKDALRQIVPIQHVETQTTTASPTASPSTGSSSLPPIIKVTSQPSHSLGTPAIAGIAVAIVLLVMIASGIGVWLRIKRNRERKRQNSRNGDTPELAATPPFPHGKAELGDEGSCQVNDRKGLRTSSEEVSDEKQTQIDQREINIMDNGTHGNPLEMSGPDDSRSELPSPDPFIGHELSSNEAELMRSELSTPEPGCAAEMPSPEMVPAEMPSPAIGTPAAGEGSSSRGASPSPLSSPDLGHSSRRTRSGRPVHGSMDSSESEGGWTRDGLAPALTRQTPYPEARQQSGWVRDRIPSSASSRQRLPYLRKDSTDSESPYPSATPRSIRPTQAHMRVDSSDSEAFTTLLQRNPSSRPTHHRLDSKDSAETFETRLEQSPPGSPFVPPVTRLARDRATEGMPSLANQSSQEALVSPSAASLRSGLRSPEPLERGLMEEDEDKASGDSEARRQE